MKNSLKTLILTGSLILSPMLIGMDQDQQFMCKVPRSTESNAPEAQDASLKTRVFKAHEYPIIGFFNDNRNNTSTSKSTNFISVDSMGTIKIWDFNKSEPIFTHSFDRQIKPGDVKVVWQDAQSVLVTIRFKNQPEYGFVYKITRNTAHQWTFERVETFTTMSGFRNFMSPTSSSQNVQALYANSKIHVLAQPKRDKTIAAHATSLSVPYCQKNSNAVDLITSSENIEIYNMQTITDFEGAIVGMQIIQDQDADYLVAASTNGNIYTWKLSKNN